MKKVSIISYLLLLFLSAGAQDQIPAFGKIDKSDILIQDCDFDPGAEALVLLNIGEIRFSYSQNMGWRSETQYRIRVKILKASGVKRAEIKIRYYSKNRKEEVTNISGISYNLDMNGNIEETKMGKKDIFYTAIDKEYAQFSFALPNVKTGTVFEYKYKIERRTFGYIPPWVFQQDIPVKYSAYDITIPEYFIFSVSSVKRQTIERFDNQQGVDTWYIMRNVPALKDEPYSSGTDSYLQRIEFQLAKIVLPDYTEEFRNTWPKLNEELLKDEDFGGALKKNIQIDEDIVTKLIGITSTKEKVRAAYKYVQTNMQWNGRYGKYSDNGIKEAWDKRSGNITDINFVLIKLLRAGGIDAKPLLASTKDYGQVNTAYPFLSQFNCVLAYVKDGSESYVMNAADKYNSFDLVPYDVLYTNALVVDKDGGGLVQLGSDRKYTNNTSFACNVTAEGKISGNTTIRTSGYARNIRMKTYKDARLFSFLENNEGINLKIDSLSVGNEEDELLAFDQKFKFSGDLQATGTYFFLPYNLFTGIGKNPFTQEGRIMRIDLDFPKSFSISGSYILTDDYIVNELPKNKKIVLYDTSIVLTRETQQKGNSITFNFTLDFRSPGYSAGNYPQIKEFFRQLYNILDERIVITKR